MPIVSDGTIVALAALLLLAWAGLCVRGCLRAGLGRRDAAILAALTVLAALLRLACRVPGALVEGHIGSEHFLDAFLIAQLLDWGGISIYPPAVATTAAPLFWFFDGGIELFQLANVFLGALTVPAVYSVAMGIAPADRVAGLAAAAVLAVLPLHVKFSGMEVLSVGMLLFGTIGVAAMLHYRRRGDPLLLALAVASTVLTAMSRMEGIGWVLIVAGAAWMPMGGRGGAERPTPSPSPGGEGGAQGRPDRACAPGPVSPLRLVPAIVSALAGVILLVPHALRAFPYLVQHTGADAALSVLDRQLPLVIACAVLCALSLARPAGFGRAAWIAAAVVFALVVASGLALFGMEFLTPTPIPFARVGHGETYLTLDPAVLNPKVTPLLFTALFLTGLAQPFALGRPARGWLLIPLWFCLAWLFSGLKATGGIAFVHMRAQVATAAPIALAIAWGAAHLWRLGSAGHGAPTAHSSRRSSRAPPPGGEARGSPATAVALLFAALVSLPIHWDFLVHGGERLVNRFETAFAVRAMESVPSGSQIIYPMDPLPAGEGRGLRPWVGPMLRASAAAHGKLLTTRPPGPPDRESIEAGLYAWLGVDCWRNGATPGSIPACAGLLSGLEVVQVASEVVPVGQESPEAHAALYIEEEFIPLTLYRVVGFKGVSPSVGGQTGSE
jgi:hypothetical protein